MEVFLTGGKRPSQPPRAGVVVRQYFAVQESQILLTTSGLDPLPANVLCDFNFIVTKKMQRQLLTVEFLSQGFRYLCDLFVVVRRAGNYEEEKGTEESED